MDLAQSETPCVWRSPLCGTWESALQLGNAFAAVANAVQPAVVFIMVETVTTGLGPRRDMPNPALCPGHA